jgi:hypothetical protein
MLGCELKTPELSTCFQTDEKIGEMNWDGPDVPTATQNGHWADSLKSTETTGWAARGHLRPRIMVAGMSSFLEMGRWAASTCFQTPDTYCNHKTTK